MEAILELILTYVSMWAPSLVAILATVYTVAVGIKKFVDLINSVKEDTNFKEVNDKLATLTAENEELIRCNKLLLDRITKIKDYADNKKNEE